MADSAIRLQEFQILGQPARAYVGGAGIPLLLIHGGWAGAAAHWSTIWDRLARRHRVVAPELPGLGHIEQPALASVREYAAWLVALLDLLGIERAWLVGNSFGGSVAWSLAGRYPERCAGVVLVNAIPMPKTPAPLHWIGKTMLGRTLMRAVLKKVSYNPAAVQRAFVDATRVPADMLEILRQDEPAVLQRFADVLIAGDGPPAPRVAPLLLWGEMDRLPGTSANDARKLQASLRGSTLRFVPNAGHCPELEAPDTFISELETFIEERRR